jgi:protein O-mannosyl-transferase
MVILKPLGRPISSNSRGAIVGICVLLVLAVLLVFGQTLRHQFLNYDDDQYFSANPRVQAGLTWNGLAWAFQTTHASNWHPLTWLSLMLDAELFGPGPLGPHLTNVILHAVNTVLLFLLLRRLTGAHGRSALVAALFGLHPLHVESVAWVSERKDVLSGLFFLLTLLMYVQYVAKSKVQGPKSKVFYGLTLCFFALGLMSKPMLVTVPFVLLLLDYWPIQRFNRSTIPRLLLEKVPFLALSMVSCLVTLFAQRQAIQPIKWLPLSQRIHSALISYIAYLGQAFYPAKLAIFYPLPENDLHLLEFTLAFILLAGISAGVLVLRQRHPCLLVGWLWYLGMLVPVIGLVQVGEQARADRYTYLPLIGMFILLVWGISELFERMRYRRQVLSIGASFTVTAALMVCASIQTSYWRNSESLWTHALACTSGNYVGHNNLGIVFAERGQSATALEQYQMALAIEPGYADAHNNLGIMLASQGRVAEATEHYRIALEIKPDFAEAHYNLGNLLARQGRPAEAAKHYQKASETRPDSPKVHYRLALTLKDLGQFEGAIVHYQKILELEPRPLLAQNALAWLLATCPDASLRNGSRAVELAQQAEQLSRGASPEILDTLAAAYAEAGRFSEAVVTAERALRLAQAKPHPPLADSIRDRLKLYEANCPYHENP